ncbi:MAG: prepilin-type N-terminal cleavage/methylation domain-containing protein, partial [Phycisphaerae bacterium]|nr:prepilin-type N-terminal cleavage/methylation domain-containing protein [Phycisphaerae bacterium]
MAVNRRGFTLIEVLITVA